MKWIGTALCALGMLACLSLSAFAAELGEPNITEQTTMKELRENPSIKGSGFYTYCNEWIEGVGWWDWSARLYPAEKALTDSGYGVYAKPAEKLLLDWNENRPRG